MPRRSRGAPGWQSQKLGLMCKLLSVRFRWAGWGRKRVLRWCAVTYGPWEQVRRPLDVSQTGSLPLRLKLQNKQIGLFHRKTEGVFQSVQCPGGGCLPRTISLIATVPWDSGMQAPLIIRGRWPRGICQAAAAKPRAPEVRTRALDMCEISIARDTGTLEHGGGGVQRWFLPVFSFQ